MNTKISINEEVFTEFLEAAYNCGYSSCKMSYDRLGKELEEDIKSSIREEKMIVFTQALKALSSALSLLEAYSK